MRGKQEQSLAEEVEHTALPLTPKKAGNKPLIIRNLPPNQKIIIAGKTVTVDGFVRRNYVFQGTREKVSSRELRRALVFKDGSIDVDGRLIKWDSKRNISNTSQLITIRKKNTDTEKVVDRKTQSTTHIHPDGTLTVNGTLIEWKSKKGLRGSTVKIEKETKNAFLQRPCIHDDGKEIIRKKTYRRKNPFLFLQHHEISEFVMENRDEMDIATPSLPEGEKTVLFSDGYDVPESLEDDYLLFPNLESMAYPFEDIQGEGDEIRTTELNEIGFQTRKQYSPTFFPTLVQSPLLSSGLQFSEFNGSLGDETEYGRDETTPCLRFAEEEADAPAKLTL